MKGEREKRVGSFWLLIFEKEAREGGSVQMNEEDSALPRQWEGSSVGWLCAAEESQSDNRRLKI